MSPRRDRTVGVTTIYWRDIPAQITATGSDGRNEKIMLQPRFQHAIDRAAQVAGLTETQAYVEQWRRVTATADDPAAQARSRAAGIENDYDKQRLEALVGNGGLEPDRTGGQPEIDEKGLRHHD